MDKKKNKNEKVSYQKTLLLLLLVFLLGMVAVNVTIGYFNTINTKDAINSLYAISDTESLRLSSNHVSMNVQEMYQFYIIGNINNHLFTWESSNPEIAFVDQNGQVFAKSSGKITITVTRDDGLSVSADVYVNDLLLFKQNNIYIRPGDKIQLDIYRSDGQDVGSLKYASSDPSVATVDENGVVTGLKEGTVYITVTDKDNNISTLVVTISTGNVTLSDKEVILEVNDQYRLWANVISSDGDGKPYKWESSNPSIVKVSENGLLTALKPGIVTITVTTKQGYVDTCKVIVKAKSKISINSDHISLDVGDTYDLFVVGNVTDSDFYWKSSDSHVVKVNQDGHLVAIAPGTVTITVRDENNNKATCIVTVSKGLDIKNNAINIGVGDTKSIIVNGKNPNELKYVSSNSEVATVDNNGNVTGVGQGETTITVYDLNGNKGAVIVKVLDSTIKLNTDSVTLRPLEEYQFSYDVQDGTSTKGINWKSSDPDIVRVDDSGLATALKPGVAVITVYGKSGVNDSCTVTVINPNNGLTLSNNKLSLDIGDTEVLKVLGDITGKRFTWTSSNPSIVKVTDGVVKALANGQSLITVKDQKGNSAECLVVVKNNAIKLSDSNLTVKVNETVSIKTSGGKAPITYESTNPMVASVDSKGNVKGLSEGVTTIKVVDANGATDICIVQVIGGNLIITNDDINLKIGETYQLNANSISSATQNDGVIIWTSSDPKVASVDKNGLVVGTGVGTATITATNSNGDKETCTITVTDTVNNKLKLNENYVSLNIGDTHNIEVLGDIKDLTFKYSSSNTDVATVDKDGVVKATGAGTAIIKVTDNKGNSSNVVIYVNNDPLKLANNNITMQVGDQENLSTNGGTGKVSYVSSDADIVSVNASGKVKAEKEGVAIITVTDSQGNVDTCVVKVVDSDIAISRTSLQMAVDDIYALDADVATTGSSKITWTSSNPDVASVTDDGKVKALKEGTTVITATTGNGKKVTCSVTVRNNVYFKFVEDNSGKGISLKNQYPISDSEGINLNGNNSSYSFKIKVNEAAVGATYYITAVEMDGNTLNSDYVKVYLESNGAALDGITNTAGKVKTYHEYQDYNDDEKLLNTGTITMQDASRGYKEIKVRIWISDSFNYTSEVNNKTFAFKINVYGYKK